jgi:hypothetical protein
MPQVVEEGDPLRLDRLAAFNPDDMFINPERARAGPAYNTKEGEKEVNKTFTNRYREKGNVRHDTQANTLFFLDVLATHMRICVTSVFSLRFCRRPGLYWFFFVHMPHRWATTLWAWTAWRTFSTPTTCCSTTLGEPQPARPATRGRRR